MHVTASCRPVSSVTVVAPQPGAEVTPAASYDQLTVTFDLNQPPHPPPLHAGTGVEAASTRCGRDERQRRRRRARDRGSASGLTRSERDGGRRRPRRGRPRPRPRAGAPRLRALRSDLRRRRRTRASASRSAGRGGCRPAAPRRSPAPAKPRFVALAGRARCRFGFGAAARPRRVGGRRVPRGAHGGRGAVRRRGLRGRGARRRGVGVATVLAWRRPGVHPPLASRASSALPGVRRASESTPRFRRPRVARASGDDAFVGASAICGDARPRGPAGGSSGCGTDPAQAGPASAATSAAAHAATSAAPRRFVLRRDDVPVDIRPSLFR